LLNYLRNSRQHHRHTEMKRDSDSHVLALIPDARKDRTPLRFFWLNSKPHYLILLFAAGCHFSCMNMLTFSLSCNCLHKRPSRILAGTRSCQCDREVARYRANKSHGAADGSPIEIPVEEIVPGDVIILMAETLFRGLPDP